MELRLGTESGAAAWAHGALGTLARRRYAAAKRFAPARRQAALPRSLRAEVSEEGVLSIHSIQIKL